MKALVLSAGKSTRIATVSLGRPKPLIEVQGASVLSRNIEWLAKSGFSDIWINLHYRPDEIRFHIGDGSQFGVKVHYSFEPEILGTAGAVKNLEKEWDGPFLVVCGDNLYNFSLKEFRETHEKNRSVATVALFDRQKHLNTGIAGGQVVVSGERILGFVEGSQEKISPYVNAGAYWLEPEILSSIPFQSFFDFGKDLFPKLIKDDIKVGFHIINGYCLGIDTPDSFQSALKILEKL
ncbi:MAG: nucleotidyltransferase family protein [Verrucomicrobia bacterium]|nr:nucleotidyltransferase family protein [Verrucomicrobiota bacterium]